MTLTRSRILTFTIRLVNFHFDLIYGTTNLKPTIAPNIDPFEIANNFISNEFA